MSSLTYQTKNGFIFTLSEGKIETLSADGFRIPLSRSMVSPFSVAERGDTAVSFQPPVPGAKDYRCDSLGLSLKAAFSASPDAIEVRCHLVNEREGDRALSFFFELPVTGRKLRWHDDIRRSRAITSDCPLYEKTELASSGSGAMSVYPIGAITGETEEGQPFGLSIGLDIAHPASFRIGYDTRRKSFQIRYDVALVPETERFPSSADLFLIVQTGLNVWTIRKRSAEDGKRSVSGTSATS